jgi:hypothetical protein
MNVHENPSSRSRVVPYGRTGMMRLIVAFRNFANARNKADHIPSLKWRSVRYVYGASVPTSRAQDVPTRRRLETDPPFSHAVAAVIFKLKLSHENIHFIYLTKLTSGHLRTYSDICFSICFYKLRRLLDKCDLLWSYTIIYYCFRRSHFALA